MSGDGFLSYSFLLSLDLFKGKVIVGHTFLLFQREDRPTCNNLSFKVKNKEMERTIKTGIISRSYFSFLFSSYKLISSKEKIEIN